MDALCSGDARVGPSSGILRELFQLGPTRASPLQSASKTAPMTAALQPRAAQVEIAGTYGDTAEFACVQTRDMRATTNLPLYVLDFMGLHLMKLGRASLCNGSRCSVCLRA